MVEKYTSHDVKRQLDQVLAEHNKKIDAMLATTNAFSQAREMEKKNKEMKKSLATTVDNLKYIISRMENDVSHGVIEKDYYVLSELKSTYQHIAGSPYESNKGDE